MEKEFCDPLNSLLNSLNSDRFKILDVHLSDYHFKEYHVRVSGNLDELVYDQTLFERKGNKLLCKCHWSVVEFIQ